MTHIDTIWSRTAHRLAAGAVAASIIGLSAGALTPAGIAHAYTGSCVGPVGAGNILQVREFSLQDVGNGNSLAIVEAYAAMSESDARSYIDRPGNEEASFRLWGDDAESDQLLASFNPERYWASPAGLGMRGSAQRSNSELDEDSGFSPEGRGSTSITPQADEFYATIRLPDFRSGSTHQVETCRLTLVS
ncbi:hypothetical protein [Mycobacterium sp. IDR2000157661]|uniref:hypothetical protein n=1 Tax=Mycobacterium sp. IDR2000157661 TaxID=2867005 RepID=UPI001EEA09D8|nr:hypothetical protein [Mycobacterium sp. IDR2000157661]ULE33270.1 hypothetical protein K3G64_25060 [Mycobacterium sp. IDR2000157661]